MIQSSRGRDVKSAFTPRNRRRVNECAGARERKEQRSGEQQAIENDQAMNTIPTSHDPKGVGP